MLHTTVRLAREAHARIADFRKVARALRMQGYTPDTPIPLALVLEHAGLRAALWTLRCVLPAEETERKRIARLFACDCAERVLPLFERVFPGERRPRQAIETARRYALGEATLEELVAARTDARIAVRAAEGDSVARAAVWSFEAIRAASDTCNPQGAARRWPRPQPGTVFQAARDAGWAAWNTTRTASWIAARSTARTARTAAWNASVDGDDEIHDQARMFLDHLYSPESPPGYKCAPDLVWGREP